MSSVCLVCGSRRPTSPPVSSRADTSKMGTAQFASTNLPKTKLPMIAATRPTPVKKPRAEDLREKWKEIQYMCMWPLWVRIKHLDGWVNQLKKIQKRNLSLIYISIHGWIWVSRLVTVALSGRAQFLRHPAHSRQSRTPRWRCRTGSDSELWSEPHRWGRHSDWTTTGCRLEKVTKMKKCMIFLLNTDLKVGVL